MLKTANGEFQSIQIQFTDQNNRQLEIEDSVNITPSNWVDIIKMRYSTESKYRKYVKRYGFLSFARRFGDKYGKKLMDTATRTVIDATKTASKRVVQKTAEPTGDLIGNKIADKITSLGKAKSKGKEDERQEIYIPPEKYSKLLMT